MPAARGPALLALGVLALAGGVASAAGQDKDKKPRQPPQRLTVGDVTASSVAAAWRAASDDRGVVGYGIYRDGTLVATTRALTITFDRLACETTIHIAVDAVDAAGIRSPRATIDAKTAPCPKPAPKPGGEGDEHARPKTPDDLKVTATTATSVSLSWSAGHDEGNDDRKGDRGKADRVAAYGLYRNGVLVGTTANTYATFSGLTCATAYAFGVDAVNADGKRSKDIATIRASTADCPPPPPPPPPAADAFVAPNGSDYAWSYLTAVYDGSQLRLSVNGKVVATRAISGPLAVSTGPLRIGGNDIWGEFFKGTIDNVRLYGRALTDAELAADATAPVTANAPAPARQALVAAYSFDETSGATATDASGTGNPGAVNGAVWTADGRFGGALVFDGAKDWVTVADSASLELSKAMTLEAWVRPSALGAVWRTVVVKQDSGHLDYGLYANAVDGGTAGPGQPSAHVYVAGADVDARGTDALPQNDCRSSAAPCLTFDRAYHAVQPGQTVQVAGGTYPDQTLYFDAAKTGATLPHVLFQPAPGASVTINGNLSASDMRTLMGASHFTARDMTVVGDVVLEGCGVPDGLQCPLDANSGSVDITLQNLRVKGPYAFVCHSCANVQILGGVWGPDSYLPCHGSAHPEVSPAYDALTFAKLKRPNHILIDGARWQNFARCATNEHTECLQFEPADYVTIRNSVFTHCDTISLAFFTSLAGDSKSPAGYAAPDHIVLENNFIDQSYDATGGTTFNGLQIGECTNCVIRNNSWLQNAHLPANPPYGEISLNNVVVGNAGLQDDCGNGGIVFSHNVWHGVSCGPTDKNVTSLGFANPAAMDLHLLLGSPAIDAGDPANFPVTDIDGQARPIGPAPDAGADER